jgi:capsule polysaccharide export protein KpsE/RkpR
MYVAMLKSRTVADALIDRFSLMNVYHKKLREETRRRLEDLTQVEAGKDGIISVSVDDRSPARAAEMANAYIDELEKLTRTLAVTDAGKRRIFFEREVKAANDELATAESQLKQTEESTGIIQLDSQAKVMLQAYADLRGQVAAKQVEIQAMRSFATPENPDLIREQQELTALQTQLSRFERGQGNRSPTDLALEKVPGAGLEYVRKLREVKYRETLFELLAKQYEAARIDEARDASVIQVMDKAVTPEKRSWPKRGLFVLAVTLFALLVGILLAYVTEGFKRTKEDPQFAAKWHLLKAYLWSGSKL